MAVENAVPWFCVFESLCAYPGNFGPGHQVNARSGRKNAFQKENAQRSDAMLLTDEQYVIKWLSQ